MTAEAKMDCIRGCVEMSPQFSMISGTMEFAESSVFSNPNNVFDCSKSIIETICKTILNDKGLAFDSTESLPGLSKKAISSLVTIVPGDNEQEEELRGLGRIQGGLISSVSGICELRNRLGYLSHGRDILTAATSPIYAQYVLNVTDAVGGFLLQLHSESSSITTRSRHYYADYQEFNEWYDEMNGNISIGGYEYDASECLFKTDPEAYKEALLEYDESKKAEENENE